MGIIQTLFSGGVNELVETVGKVVDSVTTTKEEKMQLELEMKKADMNYRMEMGRLAVEEKQLLYGDIDSARRRDTAIQTSINATKLAKNVSPWLAIGTTILSFALFATLILFNNRIAAESRDIILYILGVLSAIITQIFSFYFGSSQGSQDKNDMLRRAVSAGERTGAGV
jgi:hypothetical protein